MRMSRTACLLGCGIWLLSAAHGQERAQSKPTSQPAAANKAQSQPTKAPQSQAAAARPASAPARTAASKPVAPSSAAATQPTSAVSKAAPLKAIPDKHESQPSRFGPPGAAIESLAPAARFVDALTPEFSPRMLAWVAVVLILTLTLQTRPFLTLRNLDALVLAAMAVLVTLRSGAGGPDGWLSLERAYLLLTMTGVYWLIRGLGLLVARESPALGPNVNEAAMTVLVVAGLLVAFQHIARDPLSAGSRDGLVGGVYMAETGKLPYGVANGFDGRSPLLYAVHAAAARILPPTYTEGAVAAPMHWNDRGIWLKKEVWTDADLPTARLVNATLFILTLLGLAGIGHRQHSVLLGQTVVALFCIFPGVIECASRPEVMLPTALFAWSIAALKIPFIGSLLSVALMSLAGVASPWALLALPALLAYQLRQGWNTFGAALGLVGAFGAVAVGLTLAVKPALPRADGAIALAGLTATHAATLDGGALQLKAATSAPAPLNTLKARFWKFLLDRDELPVDTSSVTLAGSSSPGMLYRQIDAQGEARFELQESYIDAVAEAPAAMRFWTATRTLLEATWAPRTAPAVDTRGVWDVWSAAAGLPVERWTLIRRIGKGALFALALLVAFLLVRGERPQPHQLIGGLLAICSLALLVSETGAVTNLAWLMPTALGALAVRTPVNGAEQASDGELTHSRGPRITVER